MSELTKRRGRADVPRVLTGMAVAELSRVCAGPAVATRWLQQNVSPPALTRLDRAPLSMDAPLHTPALRRRWRRLARTMAAVALLAAACRAPDSVRIGWDAPMPPPKGYRILVDDRLVMTIPPPPLDPSCSCPTVWVPVPPGEHKITVIAYNEIGDSIPAAVTFVNK